MILLITEIHKFHLCIRVYTGGTLRSKLKKRMLSKSKSYRQVDQRNYPISR